MNPEARQLIKTAREQLCFAQQKLLPSHGGSIVMPKKEWDELEESIGILERILLDNPLPRTEKLI